MEITLHDILEAREARVQLQQQLLKTHQCPLICFTMNIAGPIKNTPLIQRGFRAGMEELEARLPANSIIFKTFDSRNTGNTAMYAVQADLQTIKQLCVAIEDTHPLGRLFDMDVLDIDGHKLERSVLRGCLVCGAPGRICAAGRMHSVSQLQAVTQQMLENYFLETDARRIAACAVDALIEEVNTTPKPGLVDRRNNGSHKDMTIDHFIASARVLQPYFLQCVRIGRETSGCTPEETFSLLRQAGIEAEKTMYSATGGINTHKGAIYTLGVLCGSMGRLWKAETGTLELDDILAECGKLVQKSVETDFSNADGSTAGQRLYLKYGLKGIRGEVSQCLPSVREIALPCYRQALQEGRSVNDAGVLTLLALIANVQDTNLYHRGGMEGASWAEAEAKRILDANPVDFTAEVRALDDAFIRRNLSPGGCADLLAVTYFLHTLLI